MLQNSPLMDMALRRASMPILRRPQTVEEIPRGFLDTRVVVHKNNRRQWFALSMADSLMCRDLAESLPLMSLAARDSGDATVTAWVLSQLDEMATWRPLNRPGWGLFQSGSPVAANYNDGNWLGTGWGIRAMTMALSTLRKTVPVATQTALHNLLRAVIASVRDDFRTHRVWFWDSPTSNQFVLPNCGVLLACLELNNLKGDDDYEFAVKNILRALDIQGKDGACSEGIGYGVLTNREILPAVNAMRLANDLRLAQHPHLQHSSRWLAAFIQPGLPPLGPLLVNICDGAERTANWRRDSPARDPLHQLSADLPTVGESLYDCLAWLALTQQDQTAQFVLNRFYFAPPISVPGQMLAEKQRTVESTKAAKKTHELPPTWASFQSFPIVTWRSSWKDNASGVWVKGGSPRESHGHADHGHVNWISRGKEILIEAGSGDYATPDFRRVFGSGVGHNVLQIGATEAEAKQLGGIANGACNAPIQIVRLDAKGGEVIVDASQAYSNKLLLSWTRRVMWSDDFITLEDAVQLAPGHSEVILFRFHLADEVALSIKSLDEDRCAQAAWAKGKAECCATTPLRFETTTHLHAQSCTKNVRHTVLLVSSRDKASTLNLSTTLHSANFS